MRIVFRKITGVYVKNELEGTKTDARRSGRRLC
jgi:hypothetical protein